jgi:hypothetical protein
MSANESYQRAEIDLETLTGVRISRSTQQRLVQRQAFELPKISAPKQVREMSIDGGKVRLRTPVGQACEWRDYKAVRLHGFATAAWFRQNEQLVDWVNQQSLSTTITCIGDGHDGIWNLFAQVAQRKRRRELLDWYHLVENLFKVGGSFQRLHQAKHYLWQGQIDLALATFEPWQVKSFERFRNYLEKHRTRILNYQQLQAQKTCSIGSGAVESAVKQIDRRVKISGARREASLLGQWSAGNVPQVLAQRCAYLNGCFSV